MTKISQYPEIATPDIDDLLVGTDVENSNATKNFTIQSIIDLVPVAPYKSYVALLSCTDSSTVVLNLLYSDLGTVVWTRNNAGNYTGTLSGAFTIGKTLVFLTLNNGFKVGLTSTTNITQNTVNIEVFSTTNISNPIDYIENIAVEIRVYE